MDHGKRAIHMMQTHKIHAYAKVKTVKNYAAVITDDKTGILHSLRN